eukprot:Amastigsp_a358363_42.p2 type:complete len:202 gc:universal Amastigsp_a358363_42:1021-416(-)
MLSRVTTGSPSSSSSPIERMRLSSSPVFAVSPLMTLTLSISRSFAASTRNPARSWTKGPMLKSLAAWAATVTRRSETLIARSYADSLLTRVALVTPTTKCDLAARSASSSSVPVTNGIVLPQPFLCQTSSGSARTTPWSASRESEYTTIRLPISIAAQSRTVSEPKSVPRSLSDGARKHALSSKFSASKAPYSPASHEPFT